MGVLDHHYKLFFVPPANPIILEVTKGTTKIDDPSIRPEGGIPFTLILSVPDVGPLSLP